MSGGGGGTQTVQKADPWSGIQPYLAQMYKDANNIAGQGYAIPQNSGVAPLGSYQQNVLQQIDNRANGSPEEQLFKGQASAMSQGYDWPSQLLASYAQGNGLTNQQLRNLASGTDPTTAGLQQLASGNDASSTYLKGVLGGQYLNPSSNPFLSGAVDAANSQATRQFQTAVMPQLASQFSLAGRYGSGAQTQGISDATNNLAQVLSNNANTIYAGNYSNERANQQAAANALSGIQLGAGTALGGIKNNALGTISNNQNTNAGLLSSRTIAGTQLLPQSSTLDWNNLTQRMNAADIFQQQAQNELTGQNNLFNANAQMSRNNLNWLNGILSGGMALNGSSSSSQQQVNPFRSAVGGGLSGAATGAAIGSIVPGLGTALGAGIGGAAGLLMGVL